MCGRVINTLAGYNFIDDFKLRMASRIPGSQRSFAQNGSVRKTSVRPKMIDDMADRLMEDGDPTHGGTG